MKSLKELAAERDTSLEFIRNLEVELRRVRLNIANLQAQIDEHPDRAKERLIAALQDGRATVANWVDRRPPYETVEYSEVCVLVKGRL